MIARTDAVLATPGKDWFQRFPKVFKGLSTLSGEYMEPDAKPHAIYTPRHVPLPLRPKVKQEIERMEKAGVISKVSEPTPWCAGMHWRRTGNFVSAWISSHSVRREVHPLPTVDETLAQITGAKIFSKLDANSGFWQIPLAPSSRLLTTFITPMGRYCFNKLPFGICSAPEVFQRRMNEILAGVVCQIDDILVFGTTQEEHDTNLENVLKCIEKAHVTLSKEKCEYNKTTWW